MEQDLRNQWCDRMKPIARSNRGIFITFEGGEGSGKSTQAVLLDQYFTERGHKVFLTREPQGYFRNQIFALSKNDCNWPQKELGLFLEDRKMHFAQEVIPHLTAGYIVISDRCGDSTVAYQGHARGIEHLHALRELNKKAMQSIVPDITILFDIDPRIAIKRIDERKETKTRFEEEELPFHDAVRQGFLIEAEQSNPERWYVIDAARKIGAITEGIVSELHKRFGI